MRSRFGWALATLFVVGALARLWYLDTLPSIGGDEANWLIVGLQILRGESPQFDHADMNFVPKTFGYFIAILFQIFGPSYWSARLVSVLGVLFGTLAVLGASLWWGRKLFGLVLVTLLLLHPWSLVWSRLCFAPYGLALVLAILGPLCWLRALEVSEPRSRGLALVFAGQLLVFGLHFSPLAILPMGACALWTFLRPGPVGLAPWVAAFFMAIHGWPLVWNSLTIVATSERKIDGRSAAESFTAKLARYFLVNVDVVSGEATLREFSTVAWTDGNLWLARMGVFACLGGPWAVYVARRRRSALPSASHDGDMPPGPAAVPAHAGRRARFKVARPNLQGMTAPVPGNVSTPEQRLLVLSRFSLMYLVVALVGLPLVLGAGRSWSMQWIDSERYSFAVLAPILLALAVGACRFPWFGWGVALFVAAFCVTPSLRLANALSRGGGPELGIFNFDGGGWRIWRPAQGPASLPAYLGQVLQRESQNEHVAFLVTDIFGFHPMRFETAVHLKDRVLPLRIFHNRETGVYTWPSLPADTLMLFAVWHEGMVAGREDGVYPGFFRPAGELALDRNEFRRAAVDAQLLETVYQPDGSPLVEIWRGRYPKVQLPAAAAK